MFLDIRKSGDCLEYWKGK